MYVHKGYKKSSGSCSASTLWALALMVQGLNFTCSEGLLQELHGWSHKVIRDYTTLLTGLMDFQP